MGETTPNPPNLHSITDRATHDAAINLAQGQPPTFTDAQPTLIYVSSSSNPVCRDRASPKVTALAKAKPHVAVYVMELTAETAPMIKFGLQNTPVFVLMKGKWCETVLGFDWGRVEGLVEAKMGWE